MIHGDIGMKILLNKSTDRILHFENIFINKSALAIIAIIIRAFTPISLKNGIVFVENLFLNDVTKSPWNNKTPHRTLIIFAIPFISSKIYSEFTRLYIQTRIGLNNKVCKTIT